MKTFGDVACQIAKGSRPIWLEEALKGLSTIVAERIRRDAEFSEPIDVRDDVELLKKRAIDFKEALDNVSKRQRQLDPENIEYIPVARNMADKMIDLCLDTLQITVVSRGRPSQPGRLICAVIVVELWAAVRGKAPSANNPKAQEACRGYWIACGCEPIKTGWKRTIDAARLSPLRDWIRGEIRRMAEGTNSLKLF
jgi:hypothetical protein